MEEETASLFPLVQVIPHKDLLIYFSRGKYLKTHGQVNLYGLYIVRHTLSNNIHQLRTGDHSGQNRFPNQSAGFILETVVTKVPPYRTVRRPKAQTKNTIASGSGCLWISSVHASPRVLGWTPPSSRFRQPRMHDMQHPLLYEEGWKRRKEGMLQGEDGSENL